MNLLLTHNAVIVILFVFLQVVSLSGCATTSFPVMGIRPDYPNLLPSTDVKAKCSGKIGGVDDCENYYNYLEYAQSLKGAYRSRATLNEWGLYFAGLVGLTGLTATAGLAAANAGIQALRIVPLVTGFAAGTTSVLENKEKASNYTKAANDIDSAIAAAEEIVSLDKNYVKAFGILIQNVTKAKNGLENTRVELAAKDKQLDDIKKMIRENMPKPLRLSVVDEIKLPVGESLSVKVEDGDSVDPSRTANSKPGVADIIYSADGQVLTITGRNAGETTIKFRNKDGISATVTAEVIETEALLAQETMAGGSKAITLEAGKKRAYKLPDGITGDGITSSFPEIARGQLLGDGKWVVIEAVKASSVQTSDVTFGLKEKKGVMKMTVTVNAVAVRPADAKITVSDPNIPKTVDIITGGPITRAEADKPNELVIKLIRDGQAVTITKVDKAPKDIVTVKLTNSSGVQGTVTVDVQ